MKLRHTKGSITSNIFLNCWQDPYFTWEEARDNMHSCFSHNLRKTASFLNWQRNSCSIVQNSSVARSHQPMVDVMNLLGAEVESSSDPFHVAAINQLLDIFPVMSVTISTDHQSILVNMNDSLVSHRMTYSSKSFALLIVESSKFAFNKKLSRSKQSKWQFLVISCKRS